MCLVHALPFVGRAADRTRAPASPSTPPAWLSEDQLAECATVLADGLRATPGPGGTNGPIALRLPAVENRTDLALPDATAFARQLAALVNLRTGLRIGFRVDAAIGPAAGAPAAHQALDTRLVLGPATEQDDDDWLAISLYVSVPEKRSGLLTAEYAFRPATGGPDDRAARPARVPEEADRGEAAETIRLDAGELRLATRKLAKRLKLLSDRTRREPDGRILVRLDVVAPDNDVKAEVRVEFLSSNGRLVETTDWRRHRFREGRADSIRAVSSEPADSFVVYLDE